MTIDFSRVYIPYTKDVLYRIERCNLRIEYSVDYEHNGEACPLAYIRDAITDGLIALVYRRVPICVIDGIAYSSEPFDFNQEFYEEDGLYSVIRYRE